MHFIVTGGAGFIGSTITEQLLMEGHHVTVVDNLTTGSLANLPVHPRLKFLSIDIATCKPSHFSDPVDGIAHLSATPSVTASWLQPLASHHNNLTAILDILALCQQLQIPRLVFASSAAVYGNVQESPISETHRLDPISPYGLQKLVSEQYANLFARQSNLSFIALRLFNVFGARQLANSPYSGVISIFTTAMQQELPITIYGDGHQTRDFIYVQDVATAFVQALTTPLAPGTCLSCNIGRGKGTSLRQLVTILKSYFPQWQSGVHFTNPRTGDIQHSLAAVSQAASLLNFQPQWSVESGIEQLVHALAEAKQPSHDANLNINALEEVTRV